MQGAINAELDAYDIVFRRRWNASCIADVTVNAYVRENYAITAWLAAAGGLDRARRNPLLPIAMGIKLVLDGVTNIELAREEWSENKAFCEYCQVATVCSIASIVLAVPEVMTAVLRR